MDAGSCVQLAVHLAKALIGYPRNGRMPVLRLYLVALHLLQPRLMRAQKAPGGFTTACKYDMVEDQCASASFIHRF